MLDEGSVSGASSGASSPEPEEPFIPKFKVQFSGDVNKDGDSVKFTLQVSQNGLTSHVLEREYEDFEYLDHCVSTGQSSRGLIIPPIPQRSAIDPYNAEIQSKRLMGKGCKTLIADEFHKDCQQLQKYLELLLSHPVLGRNEKLHDFLTEKNPPPRTKVKKGLMSKLADTLDARKSSYPDSEEFFQKERDWVSKYQPAIAHTSETFNKITCAQLRISHQLEQMVTALKVATCPNEEVHHRQYNNINAIFLDCTEKTKNETEDKGNKEDMCLGSTLGLWSRYTQSEGNMLLERTCLMVDYQSCNRALDKAKPNRKEAAEKAKKEAEVAFEECSDAARQEIKHFQRQRVQEVKDSVERYAAFQLTSARTALNTLSIAFNQIRAMNL